EVAPSCVLLSWESWLAAGPPRSKAEPPRRHWPEDLVAEVPLPGENHRHVVAVGNLDRHLVADRATRLDDRRHPRLGRHLDAVREREVGVAGHDRRLRPVAGAPERNLD